MRSGDWFDYGNVCTNSQQGFYYIQSSCTNLTSRPMTVCSPGMFTPVALPAAQCNVALISIIADHCCWAVLPNCKFRASPYHDRLQGVCCCAARTSTYACMWSRKNHQPINELVMAVQFAMDPFSANWCSRKVSRGAAVGIAIAFFLLLFVFIIAIYYFVRRRQLNQV